MRITVRQLSAAFMVALALVAFGASPAFAQIGGSSQPQQEEQYEGFGIGVKGGWLFTNFDQEGIEFDQRSGYQFGVWFGGNRSGVVGVMAEVNYGKKGAEIVGIGGSDPNYDVTFVGVPVLLRVNVGSRSRSGVNVYGVVGPEIDWLINQSLLGVDLEEDTEGFELGLVVGGGIEITRFLVELRYVQGLRSISRTFDLSETTELKTKSFAILFGVRFN